MNYFQNPLYNFPPLPQTFPQTQLNGPDQFETYVPSDSHQASNANIGLPLGLPPFHPNVPPTPLMGSQVPAVYDSLALAPYTIDSPPTPGYSSPSLSSSGPSLGDITVLPTAPLRLRRSLPPTRRFEVPVDESDYYSGTRNVIDEADIYCGKRDLDTGTPQAAPSQNPDSTFNGAAEILSYHNTPTISNLSSAAGPCHGGFSDLGSVVKRSPSGGLAEAPAPTVPTNPPKQTSQAIAGPERSGRKTKGARREKSKIYVKPEAQESTNFGLSSGTGAHQPNHQAPKDTVITKKYLKNQAQPSASKSQVFTVVCCVNDCDAECEGKEQFLKHIATTHNLIAKHNNDYRCFDTSCQHVAGGKDALINHMRAIHHQIILREHIPEHTTRIQCPWSGCERQLKVSSLHRHISSHVKTTFRCPLCPNKRCSRLSDYQRHFVKNHRAEFDAGEYMYEEIPF